MPVVGMFWPVRVWAEGRGKESGSKVLGPGPPAAPEPW